MTINYQCPALSQSWVVIHKSTPTIKKRYNQLIVVFWYKSTNLMLTVKTLISAINAQCAQLICIVLALVS